MRARWQILFLSIALGGACAHTKTTDDGTEKTEKKEDRKDEGKEAEAKPRAAAPLSGQARELHPGNREAVPVATAPDALLKPGADDKIRERLGAGGFLPRDAKASEGSMRDGLRRFQKANDLPATGVPDHETVKKLGLDPDQTFRKATVKN